jgi:hypothetical protein
MDEITFFATIQPPPTDDVEAIRQGARAQLDAAMSSGPRPARHRRRPLVLAGAAATAAAAVTAATVTLALPLGGSPRTGGPGAFPALPNPPASAVVPPVLISPGQQPSAASLAKAMLTAFNAATDDLAYETRAGFRAGRLMQTDQTWSWPAVPSPGQVQYTRDAFSAIPWGASEATAPVKLTEDDGYTTVTPHPSPYGQTGPARLITVCYAVPGPDQTGCGWGHFNTPAGTWSQHTAVMPYIDFTPSPHGADLARQVAHHQWRIVGHTRLRGQPAIKLAETRSGEFMGHPVLLWVSTSTYLPLRMILVEGKATEVDNWYYLPPTKANLAHLRVPIPSGYPRSG